MSLKRTWKRKWKTSALAFVAASSGVVVAAHPVPASAHSRLSVQNDSHGDTNNKHGQTEQSSLSAPSGLRTYAVTSSLIDLIWNPTYLPNVTYEVYQDGNKVADTTKSNYTASNLTPGHTYHFEVVVKDASGNQSKASTLIVSTKKEGTQINVTDLGAVGDSTKDDTASLQEAIDQCPTGGTVYIPAGTYYTAPLTLKSDMTLYLAEGATLLGSHNIDQYQPVWSRWEGTEMYRYQSLLYGNGVKNVTIAGHGTLDGNGSATLTDNAGNTFASWWSRGDGVTTPNYKEPTTDPAVNLVESSKVDPSKSLPYARPGIIEFSHSQNILIQGLKIQNSPAWTIHPLYSQNVTLADLDIENPPTSDNTDGVDPDSVTNMNIINNTFNVGDDDIAIKSGKDLQGRQIGIPSSNIVIRNNLMEAGHGGVTMGSEMSGGINNVVARDDVFDGTKIGIRMKSLRGRGGTIKNLIFDHITMNNIGDAAVHIDERYSSNGAPEAYTGKVDAGTPRIQNITFSNITDNGAKRAMFLRGLTEMNIQNLTFDNVSISNAKDGIQATNVSNVLMHNVSITGDGISWFHQGLLGTDVDNDSNAASSLWKEPSEFKHSEFNGFLNGTKVFDGSTSVSLPSHLLNSGQGSISVGVKPDGQAGNILSGSGDSTTGSIALAYTKDQHLEFTLSDGSKTVDLVSPSAYKDINHPLQITASWGNGVETLYVDGKTVAQGKTALTNVDVSSSMALGENVGGFKGEMQDAALYNYAISVDNHGHNNKQDQDHNNNHN